MILIYFYPRAVENSNIQVKHTIPLQNSELQRSYSVNRSITPVGNLAFLKQKIIFACSLSPLLPSLSWFHTFHLRQRDARGKTRKRRRGRQWPGWVKTNKNVELFSENIHLMKHLLKHFAPMKLCCVKITFFFKFECTFPFGGHFTSILIVPFFSSGSWSPIRYQSFLNLGSGARRIHTRKS